MLKKLARTCLSHRWLARSGVALDRATVSGSKHGLIPTVATRTWSLPNRPLHSPPRVRLQGRTAHTPTSPDIESVLPRVSARMPGR